MKFWIQNFIFIKSIFVFKSYEILNSEIGLYFFIMFFVVSDNFKTRVPL